MRIDDSQPELAEDCKTRFGGSPAYDRVHSVEVRYSGLGHDALLQRVTDLIDQRLADKGL